MENNTLQRFSATELRALDSFLKSQTSGMSLVKAHGFITAVVSFPDLYMPNEWIPILVGDLKNLQDRIPAKTMLDNLITLYKQITENLSSKPRFEFILSADQPYMTLDDAPYDCVQEWCNGYCLALVWNEEEWLHTKEEFITQACATFFILTNLIHNKNKQPNTREWQRDQKRLIKNLPELVKTLYTYWLGKQDAIFAAGLQYLQNQTICPCGSSKSYNSCCRLKLELASIH